MDDQPAIPDLDRSILLSNGFAATVAVTPDGRDVLWLMDPDAEHGTYVCPAHEHLGALPPHISDTLHAARCGAVKANGRPCRALVHAPSDHCHHHAPAARRQEGVPR